MRLFAAILPDQAVREALLAAQSILRDRGTGRFSPPEGLHLTLAFLGETEDLEGAEAALEAVSSPGPFSLCTGGLGHFGDLWWAGTADSRPLETLALDLQTALRARGFPIEDRPWQPHITLVRRWKGPDPELQVPRAAMMVRLISLLRSDQTAGGSVYTEVCRRFL